MPTKITLIMAYGPNGELGHKGGLPWQHHPEDMRRFKEATLGHTVIMGRKTYESLGRPLPWRNNVVVSRRPDRIKGDVSAVKSLEDAVGKCEEGECFIIGGANLYQQAISKASRVLLTEMQGQFEADVYFKIPFIHHWIEESREHWGGAGGPCDFVDLRMSLPQS